MPTAKNSKLERIVLKLVRDGDITVLEGIGITISVDFVNDNPPGDWIGTEITKAIEDLTREY